MTRGWAILASGVTIAALGGTLAAVRMAGPGADALAPCRSTQVAGGTGSIGGDFRLTDAAGRSLTQADVLARPALVYFGYTFCPDICPFDMARNAEAVSLLDARGIEVTPVFVSVDPERDTPAALADWVAAFHPRLVALSGSREEIDAAARGYKVYYHIPPHAAGEEFYTVDHTTFTYLMLPGTGFAELYRRDAGAAQIAESVACFVGAAERSS